MHRLTAIWMTFPLWYSNRNWTDLFMQVFRFIVFALFWTFFDFSNDFFTLSFFIFEWSRLFLQLFASLKSIAAWQEDGLDSRVGSDSNHGVVNYFCTHPWRKINLGYSPWIKLPCCNSSDISRFMFVSCVRWRKWSNFNQILLIFSKNFSIFLLNMSFWWSFFGC